MKKLILPINNGHRLRMQDYEYIQQGSLFAFASIVKSYLPLNYTGLIIVEGCNISVVGTTYTLSSGSIYYKPSAAPSTLFDVEAQGEILQVDAQQIISSSPPQWEVYRQVPAFSEPRLFDDNTPHFINQEWKARLKTGAGLALFNSVRRLEHIKFNRSKELYELITIPKLPAVNFLTDNFDGLGLGKPFTKYEGFSLANGSNNSIDMQGFTAIGYNQSASDLANVRGVGDYLAATIGSFVGKMKHVLTIGEMPSHSHGGVPLVASDTDKGGNGSGFDLNNSSNTYAEGGSQEHENRQPSRVSIIIQKVSEITA